MLNIEDVDDKKWSGLQWGVVNGHSAVVKILLEKMKSLKINQSRNNEEEHVEESKDHKKNEFDEIFKKPPNSSSNGKYNPLHWASYKGQPLIISLLIKHDFNPLDIDDVGNTSLHQAAASNRTDAFLIFMGLGIDLEIKNDRGHMAIDLTTNKDIKDIIQSTLAVKFCVMCNTQFNFHQKRHLCKIDRKVICKKCCVTEYVYSDENSDGRDMIECRCKECDHNIRHHESLIKSAIHSNNLEEISKNYHIVLNGKIQVCPKLMKRSLHEIDRLEREKKIDELLNNLKIVENHKTIEKSVYILETMIKQAKELNIELDGNVIEKAFSQKDRLLAEKELRKLSSNLTIEMASYDNLHNLQEKISNATKYEVDEKYILYASDLAKKIELNLKAKELLESFLAYPVRIYPVVEVVDPKKRGNVVVKKPEPEKKKKRKKKEPHFLIPDWAKELKVVTDKVFIEFKIFYKLIKGARIKRICKYLS